jgi:transposase-like protein
MTTSYPMTCPLCHSTNLEKTETDDRDFFKCHSCQWSFGGRIHRERLSETGSHGIQLRQTEAEEPTMFMTGRWKTVIGCAALTMTTNSQGRRRRASALGGELHL